MTWRLLFNILRSVFDCFSSSVKSLWASPVAQLVKNPLANAEDAKAAGLISGLGRSSGEGNDNPFQYSCLENSMDRGAWWLQSLGSQSHTWLSTHITPFWVVEEPLCTHTHTHTHTWICLSCYLLLSLCTSFLCPNLFGLFLSFEFLTVIPLSPKLGCNF